MSDRKYNVDAEEIAKFSRIADKWWDKSGEFKPLHDINPLRLDYIDGHADLCGKRVLDVGCGGGILAESMARRGAALPFDAGEAAPSGEPVGANVELSAESTSSGEAEDTGDSGEDPAWLADAGERST